MTLLLIKTIIIVFHFEKKCVFLQNNTAHMDMFAKVFLYLHRGG